MRKDLFSGDATGNMMYRHVNITVFIDSSWAQISPHAVAFQHDSVSSPGQYNLLTSDAINDKIYVYDGYGSTIINTSFASPGTLPSGLAYTQIYGDLFSFDAANVTLYHHSGISSTLLSAIPMAERSDLTITGYDLVSCSNTANKIYVHQKWTTTITTSFASPGPEISGLGWDGANLLSCDFGNDKIYVHNGVTSTITDSFASPGTNPYALGWPVSQSVFTIDAVISESGTKTATFTLDALIAERKTVTFTLDSLIRETKTATFTLDGLIAERKTRSFTLDAIIGAQTATFTLDAVIKETKTATFTIDAVIQTATDASIVMAAFTPTTYLRGRKRT